jgi:hypothetical protein
MEWGTKSRHVLDLATAIELRVAVSSGFLEKCRGLACHLSSNSTLYTTLFSLARRLSAIIAVHGGPILRLRSRAALASVLL